MRARRHKGELRIIPFDPRTRAQAQELAAALIAVAEAHVGERRDAFDEACAAVVAAAAEPRLAAGLAKLVDDAADFDVETTADPVELRRDVFARASLVRRALGSGERFAREQILTAVAAQRGLDPATIERTLYADLRGAHRLTSFAALTPAMLVDAYEDGQAQAVLLRAVRVVVEVDCASPAAYRLLFRRLKFHRLLHTITPRSERGYRIEIDGPFSLFESATRYGLALAMALPAIRACDHWRLDAELRWGPERSPLRFQLAGTGSDVGDASPHVSDEVAALIKGVEGLGTRWDIFPAETLLDLPGAGVCVPDVVFTHRDTGECVYLEVLGYWSRPAVWRRVELVERGLADRVVFAVGQHLRVSEAALDSGLPGALYVYKRTMSARALVDRVEALTRVDVRPTPSKPRRRPVATK